MKSPNSTWYVITGGNDIAWRVSIPAKAIGGKVNEIPETGGYYALTQPNTDSAFKWVLNVEDETGLNHRITSPEEWSELTEKRIKAQEIVVDYIEHEGVAVWIRPDLCRATHAQAMRIQSGCRIVAEFDDNYLTSSKFNIFMRSNKWSDDDRYNHMKSIASMDAIITTTEWLRDYYYKALVAEFGKKIPDIHICGNHIDDSWLDTQPIPSDRLRVGYMGSESHLWDVKLIYPAMKWAYDAGHEVVFIGIDPKWRRYMDYTYIPWSKPEEYRREALPIDIGLAPIVYNNHTNGKSDIKAMEYLLSGATPIVQNCIVYNKTFEHGETALLAGSPEEFWMLTQRLCNDPKLRADVRERGMQYIRENRLISQHTQEWKEAVLG